MKNSFKGHLLISFGVIFAAIGLAAGGIYYFSNDLKTQAQKIIADKTLIAKQAAVLGILADLKRDAPIAAAYGVAIEKLLPSHDKLIGFSSWVTGIGQSHNVSVSFSFRGDNTLAAETNPGTDGFSMTVNGPFPGIVSFLKDLETQAPGYLHVETFDLVNIGPDYRLSTQGKLFSQ